MLRRIKAVPGKIIRIPGQPGNVLSHDGWLAIEFDSYWARRERSGDILVEALPVVAATTPFVPPAEPIEIVGSLPESEAAPVIKAVKPKSNKKKGG